MSCIDNNAALILNIFELPKASTRNFSKHYSKLLALNEKRFQKSSRKHFHRITNKTIFRTFWHHKNIFIALKYSENILGMILKQTFVECSSIILETLLYDYWNLPKDQRSLLSNQTLLTQKKLFLWELLKKFFPLNCSLNVPRMSRTLQRRGNTQRIFLEYCVPAGKKPSSKMVK